MAKPLNNMQKLYIENNRGQTIDVLIAETGAAKTVIEKFIDELEPLPVEEAPQPMKKEMNQSPFAQMGRVDKEPGKSHLKGVRILTKEAAEQGDERRKRYGRGNNRYKDAIAKIDPDAGTY